MYDFQEQLALGKAIESELDTFFAKWYTITPVSLQEEIQSGIDRKFVRNDKEFKVEYKADFKAYSTGNIYAELSVNSDNGRTKAGWAVGSKADYIIYALVTGNAISSIYVLPQSVIAEKCEVWKGQYRNVKCMNRGYHSVGVVVPLTEVETIAKAKYKSV